MEYSKLIPSVQTMFVNENFKFKQLAEVFPEKREYFADVFPVRVNREDRANRFMDVEIGGIEGKIILPAFGYLNPGRHILNTEDKQKTMCYLIGEMAWGLKGEDLIVPEKYDKLIIPAGEDYILDVKTTSLYLCDYLRVE